MVGGIVIVAGDIHGTWGALNALIVREKPNIILQCGDFGYWPRHPFLDPAAKLRPKDTTIHWVEGNHEDLAALADRVAGGHLALSKKMPNVLYQPRGSVIELPDGRTALFVGGAFSVDNRRRLPGKDWFPDLEILKESDLVNFPDPTEVEIDIVISHTRPKEFDVQGLPYEQWPKWWDRDPDPSERVLSEILKRYQPKQWFLGHFHRFQKGTFEGCEWTALAHAGSGGTWWVEL